MTVFISERSWFGDEGFMPGVAAARQSEADPIYVSQPAWGSDRSYESAETNRLNRAHWLRARDVEVNSLLIEQLATLRARATYEARNDGTVAGICNTLVEDVVGPNGPTLQVICDDDAYADAAEKVWQEWFAAPTFRVNLSGTALLKLWVRNLPRCGEFLAKIGTDENAESQVQMRLQPIHPRRMATPSASAANQRMVLGVELDDYDRPVRYWIANDYQLVTKYSPYPPDLIIHEFTLDEEGQARGWPWAAPTLQSGADLRDYDVQVMDAARNSADQYGLLYTDHPDAPVWTAPESMNVPRRSIKMAPPGWKPSYSPATMPPVQYPEFRSEKQRDIGRPMNMPLLMVRLDSSKHNYSSARLDTQSWNRTVYGVQSWIGGTPTSYGTLTRLVDLVLAEARFTNPKLRRRPKLVQYLWMWPPRPHVDPTKEADAETIGLENRTLSFGQALAFRGVPEDVQMMALQRDVRLFERFGLQQPAWMAGAPLASTPAAREVRAKQAATEESKETKEDTESKPAKAEVASAK